MGALRRRILTVAISGAGTAVFALAGLPLPALFGPMFACLAAALAGAHLATLGVISVAARTMLGLAIGCSLTPDVAARLPAMALSVSLVPAYVGLIALVGVPFFRRIYRFDMTTAWYAAMPGGLQDMVLFGTEAGGDGRALALVHTTRVLIIVTLAPVVMVWGFGARLDQPMGVPAAAVPPRELALMVAAALVGWKGGERLGLFGAPILGPMIVSGALTLGGFLHMRPPAEAIVAAQFLIGLAIGAGYVGVTLAELRRDVAAGCAFVVILAALATAMSQVVVALGLARPTEAFLAFAPGGQAELTLLAIVAGADLGYVIVHHLVRVFVVITGAPLVSRLFGLRGPP